MKADRRWQRISSLLVSWRRTDQLIFGLGPIDVFENATGPDRLNSTGLGKTCGSLAIFGERKRKVLIFASERRLNVGQCSSAGRIDFGHTPQVENDCTHTGGRRALGVVAEHLRAAEKEHALELKHQNVPAALLK